MPKINKLSVRSGLYKLVGEFGLRENLYYGSIFLCMTLIVIVCFVVINNRGGGDELHGSPGGAAAIYDSGKGRVCIFQWSMKMAKTEFKITVLYFEVVDENGGIQSNHSVFFCSGR